MKIKTLILFLALISFSVVSIAMSQNFAAAALEFLKGEEPILEKAVEANDLKAVSKSNDRMGAFLETWGIDLNSGAPSLLNKYPGCSQAMSDFMVRYLCRLRPPATVCYESLEEEFQEALASCRASAKANK